MADINHLITWGIGTPGDIEHFILDGLNALGLLDGLHVYVDMDGDGVFADDEEITDYVMLDPAVEWEYGRDYASQLVGKSTAGKLTALLWNNGGEFSPANTGSPYYLQMLPGRLIKVSIVHSGVEYIQWVGLLENIEPISPRPNLRVARLTALGVLSAMQHKVDVEGQANILTGDAITAVLDAIDWPAALRDIDTGNTTMLRWFPAPNETAFSMLRAIEETEAGFLRETKDGKIAFEDRHHRLTGVHLTSQAEYSDDPADDIHPMAASHGDPLRELYNVITAESDEWEVQALAVLWEHPEYAPGWNAIIKAGQSYTVQATFPNKTSNEDAVSVDAWTTPVATTDYTFNSELDGSGSNLTANISVSVVKTAHAMDITYTNNGAIDGALRGVQARGTELRIIRVANISEADAISQIVFGTREYSIPAKFLPSTEEARDRALAELSVRAWPLLIISMRLSASVNSIHKLDLLQRDVSERVTIDFDGVSGLYITEDYFIEHLKHSYSNAEHVVEMELSPASGYTAAIVLDVGPPLDTGVLWY